MATDSKARFTTRVADYVNGRPTYPAAVLDVLRDRIGFAPAWRVVDVGAGTGISTNLFLAAGNRVTAVEPNDAMRAAADEQFAASPDYRSVAAPAEATTLPDGSADLVVAAQAFHWFDHHAFARECRRLLSPRGRVLLMWNTFRPNASPAAEAYDAIVRRYAVDLARVQGKWTEGDNVAREWFTPESYTQLDLNNPQHYDAARLFTRMVSSSYMPQRGDPVYEPMRADLDAAFARHAVGGTYTLPYACELFIGVPNV